MKKAVIIVRIAQAVIGAVFGAAGTVIVLHFLG